jgi:hypothetical protein
MGPEKAGFLGVSEVHAGEVRPGPRISLATSASKRYALERAGATDHREP